MIEKLLSGSSGCAEKVKRVAKLEDFIARSASADWTMVEDRKEMVMERLSI